MTKRVTKKGGVKFLIYYFAFFVVGVLFVISYFYSGLDIKQYLWVALLICIIYVFFIIAYTQKDVIYWYYPFSLVLGFYCLFSVAGIMIYQLREIWWFNYPAEMDVSAKAALIGLVGLLLGRWYRNIIQLPRKFIKRKGLREFNIPKLKRITWAYITVGNIAAGILYNFYTNLSIIPLLSSNSDGARYALTRYSPGKGSLWILMLLLMIAIPQAYVVLLSYGKLNLRRWFEFIFQFILSFIPLTLYAGRFYFLTPLVMLILVHVFLRKSISIIKMGIVVAVILLFAMGFVAFRVTGSPLGGQATRIIWADLFPEMRSFAMAVYFVGNPKIWKQIIVNIVSSWLPSIVFSLVGEYKPDFLFSIGRFVTSNVDQSLRTFGGGIRAGLLGESYFAYGFLGVLMTFFFLGFITTAMDKIINEADIWDVRRFRSILMSIVLALSIPYGTNMFITSLFIFIFVMVSTRYSEEILDRDYL